MEKQLKLEELGMFVFGIVLFASLEFSWWVFPVLLLVPDVSMAGYWVNNRIGAIMYNLFHHKGFAVAVYIAGVVLNQPILQLTGIILFSHSSLDRMLGYGLKFPDSFQHTHLGWVGSNENK